jgi:MoxR-like ATPase
MKAPDAQNLIEGLTLYYEGRTELTTGDIKAWCEEVGYVPNTVYNRLSEYKTGRGKFSLDSVQAVAQLEETYQAPAYQSLVPVVDQNFVPFGNFKDVKQIIKSGVFYPVFITGLSGNGKTHSVEQSCAQLNRDCVRVNITIETDEDDLIGGFRLVNGDTVWHDGPVVEALKRGAILLLDEVDLASNKIMCLQSLLEGKGVYLKKTNEYVKPSAGFNVIATANTKGKGDDTGMFIGANILNEAFLERFAVTFEQEYPTPTVETKILTRILADLGQSNEELIKNLVTWAEIIRKTYDDGGVDAVITTRRLINVLKAFVIWDDVNKSIDLCINRFDDDTKQVFKQLFDKIVTPTPDYETESDIQSDSEPTTF